jgi:flagellar motility protein MotE (MotC chaperone)
MKNLQAEIEKLLAAYDEQQEKKVTSLVKIYETMKPKEAAKIFEELEMDVLLMVVERINSRRLAPILAAMNPQKAREVTVELSRLRNLPGGGIGAGG